jgi:RNA polymerase sigma-70 factor (ECF subfamily)
VIRRFTAGVVYRMALINGEPGLLRFVGGQLESAQAFVIEGDRIATIYVVRNPDKLAAIDTHC